MYTPHLEDIGLTFLKYKHSPGSPRRADIPDVSRGDKLTQQLYYVLFPFVRRQDMRVE